MAKDFLGKELSVGDEVVFMRIHYRDFTKGVITKLTAKKAHIQYEKDNLCRTHALQFHNQLIKVT